MTQSIFPISEPVSSVKARSFDVIVVGSGYGGSIAAARLAAAGQKVCLLERGREILPGSYPTDLQGALRETQITTAEDGRITKDVPDGMLDLRINDDMNVIVGCGLGGTSLINANVALETDPRTFWQKDAAGNYLWPAVFRSGKDRARCDMLEPYYVRARKMLGTAPLPDDHAPNKLKSLQVSADAIGQPVERAPINVTFEDGPNAAGVFQKACTMCGDCCSGCNYGAKNTTLMNYLPYAKQHGAEIVTQAQVTHVEAPAAKGGKWTVHLQDMSVRGAAQQAHRLQANIVVLAAGTLGSTEILLRSQAKGLNLSRDRLGKRFSGNGDVLGFGFDANWNPQQRGDGDRPAVWAIGAGAHYPLAPARPGDNSAYRPGPCITGVIKVGMGQDAPVEQAAVIEEGVGPGALSMIYPALFFMSEALHGQLTRFPDTASRLGDAQALGTALMSGTGLSELSYTGALSRTQPFLLMSHDSSGGEIVMNEKTDTAYLSWPGVGTEPPYVRDNDLLRDCADGIWANYLPNPLWHENFGNRLITVHPVGGCCMGDSCETGVVNADCHVFTGKGDEVYDGLLVCDGSVMPTSLGLNPLLTISAVTERAMDVLVKTLGKPNGEAQAKPEIAAGAVAAEPAMSVADEWSALVKYLTDAKDWLRTLREEIKGKKWEEAAEKIYEFAKDMNEEFQLGYGNHLSDYKHYLRFSDELPEDIGPAIDQVLGVLDPLLSAARDHPGNYAALIEILEEHLGDFSPNLTFSETMAGFVATPPNAATAAISDPYDVAARIGESQGQSLTAEFSVHAQSIRELTVNPAHRAKLKGTVTWTVPNSKSTAYDLADGEFQLLKQDAADVETWQMIYSGGLVAGDASDAAYYFRGVKTLARREGSDWWTDLTTLYIDICHDEQGNEIAARGIVKLGLQEFLRQLQTMGSVPEPVPGNDDGNDVLTKLILDTVPEPKGYGGIRYGILDADLKTPLIRQQIIQQIVKLSRASDPESLQFRAAAAAMRYYQMQFAAFFALLVFRSYGGLLSYLSNFPQQDRLAGKVTPLPSVVGAPLRNNPKIISEWHTFSSAPNVTLQLIRYNGGAKGPVILAPGFATAAQSFAMETVDTNLVEVLCAAGYDVWLFDYRGSPALGATSLQPFTVDDIATQDWPAAVDYVLQATGAKSVQAVVHCLGSLSFLMALLSGRLDRAKIRSAVCSQLTVHPVTNWFNQMKADTKMASRIIQGVPKELVPVLDGLVGSDMARLFQGLKTIDANSPSGPNGDVSNEAQALNLLTWRVPFPNGIPCYSPTCHRVFGIYGPICAHEQLNETTHDAIQTVFGEISTKPFEQISLIVRKGYAVNAQGRDVYLPNHANLRIPIHFIAGALNQEFTPDTSLRTYDWLCKVNADAKDLYSRQVFKDYAHMDCFIGKRASRDIFPSILKQLENHPSPDCPPDPL